MIKQIFNYYFLFIHDHWPTFLLKELVKGTRTTMKSEEFAFCVYGIVDSGTTSLMNGPKLHMRLIIDQIPPIGIGIKHDLRSTCHLALSSHFKVSFFSQFLLKLPAIVKIQLTATILYISYKLKVCGIGYEFRELQCSSQAPLRSRP